MSDVTGKPMLIYGKIADIMQEVEPIAKGRKNSSQNYNFRGVEDVYNAVQPVMAKHRVFSSPEILESTNSISIDDRKREVVRAILKVRVWFYAEDGSKVFADVQGEGMDYGGDKASNKAMSVAHKYAVLQILMIPTMVTDSESDERIGAVDPEDQQATARALIRKRFEQCGADTTEKQLRLLRFLTRSKTVTLDQLRSDVALQGSFLKALSRDKEPGSLLNRATEYSDTRP